MNSGITIQSPGVTKATAENVSTGIIHILQAGSQTHTPQDVMMQALGVFRDVLNNVAGSGNAITNCIFNGDKQITN